MIKILNILSSLDGGGVESMITNYYSQFPDNDIQFDFIVHNPKEGILEKDLLAKGSKIYHITPKKTSISKNIKELYRIIDAKEYDAIYCHQNFISFIPLLIGRLKGIKVRIVHSHGCNPPRKLHKKIINKIERFIILKNATNFFSCGKKAAEWLYGRNWKEEYPKKVIINNAVDTNKFAFSKELRNELRKKYNVEDKVCIFHAGRFSHEKNHKFIIDCLSKLPSDKYWLFLAGDGELYDDIINYSSSLDLKNITFLGMIKDVYKYYSMADIFLLPSFNEGFPVTLVEAQVSSLKCIASTNVPKETKILDKTCYFDLDDMAAWIREIENVDVDDRRTETQKIKERGFDTKSVGNQFYKLLKEICR